MNDFEQLYDLVTNYQPELIFADGEWEQSSQFWHTPDFVAWLYNEYDLQSWNSFHSALQ